MAKLIDKILGGNVKSTTSAEDYTEIDLSKYEEVLEDEPAETYVKIAEVSSINQVSQLKQEIYNGNILMIDISNIRGDDLLRDRVLKELKDVVIDVHGDIAGVKGNTVIVTPTGIKIDRSKDYWWKILNQNYFKQESFETRIPCPLCQNDLVMNWQRDNIPYFGEIMYISAKCQCSFRFADTMILSSKEPMRYELPVETPGRPGCKSHPFNLRNNPHS